MIDIEKVREVLQSIPYLHRIDLDIVEGDRVEGCFEMEASSDSDVLIWTMQIDSCYPMKIAGNESIHFSNKELLPYPHIMEDGCLCMHTRHAYDICEKLKLDIEQLKGWVEKYYVNQEVDDHYEHLVVNESLINDSYYVFQFSHVDKTFSKGEYGIFKCGESLCGQHDGYKVHSAIVLEYKSASWGAEKRHVSDFRLQDILVENYYGIYCIVKNAPSLYNKFIVKDYTQLNALLTDEQLHFIYEARRKKELSRDGYVPFMIGYSLPSGEDHWQTAMLPTNKEITTSNRIKIPGSKQNIWNTRFIKGDIQWVKTLNISYEYFYGRGAMKDSLASKHMLVLGVGAIGSMVAVALARNGAKQIVLYDFDVKEPENVCRSEYHYVTGIGYKTDELRWIINMITPHTEVHSKSDKKVDYIFKHALSNPTVQAEVFEFLKNFDVVFDCTTDNDVMKILDKLNPPCKIVNLSISNHANELVCAFSPYVSDYVEFVYSHFIDNDVSDLYYPTGCWSPTFKASYTDIASLVQYAMKRILKMISGLESKTNFYLKDTEEGIKMIKL